MTSADILSFLRDITLAVVAGALATGFIAIAVFAIVLNGRREREKARRNLEALADANRVPSGGLVA